MTHEALHTDGPILSRIIAGAWRWNIPSSNVAALIHRALEKNITTFDHADIYGDHQNEQIFGQVLAATPSLRDQMQLVTKCGIKFKSPHRPETWVKHYNTSAAHIIWSVENSLKMLHTDRIDLLLIHRPDPLLNPAEVAQAFSTLKREGKVLHFGVSNFTASQFNVLNSYMDQPLVTNQLEISLTHHQALFDGGLDNMMQHRAAPMAWSPLGGGKLVTEPSETLSAKAAAYSASPTQILLAWLLRHPARIFPVIGTTKPDRLDEAAAAVNILLDTQDWFDLLKSVQGKEMP